MSRAIYCDIAGLAGIVAIAITTQHSIRKSAEREATKQAAAAAEAAETARTNFEIGKAATAQARAAAEARDAAYERTPERQLLRALEAEDRREAQRPPSPTPAKSTAR